MRSIRTKHPSTGGKRARRSSHLSHQAGRHAGLSRQLREVRPRAADAPSRPTGRLHVLGVRRDQHARPHLGLRGRRRPHEAPRRHAGGSRLAGVRAQERRGRQSRAADHHADDPGEVRADQTLKSWRPAAPRGTAGIFPAEDGMRAKDNMRSGGEVLVDQLIVHGARHVFCVPGESYLAALDAFHDRDIAVTVCRQEGGAAMMAEAHGKLTGRPGICFVTRGPGATNAAPGIHIAQQDSTPLIMFVGQVARETRGRDAFQELDCRAVFGGMAKWATEIDDSARVPEIVSRAFYTATSGRPGPVVIALPEDMLTERIAVADATAFEPVETRPGQPELAQLEELLAQAERPVLILG